MPSNAASSEEIAGTSEEINSQAQIMTRVVVDLNQVVYGSKSGETPGMESFEEHTQEHQADPAWSHKHKKAA
ncbi:hypothetical protein D3C87_2127330 [compost metagenome]